MLVLSVQFVGIRCIIVTHRLCNLRYFAFLLRYEASILLAKNYIVVLFMSYKLSIVVVDDARSEGKLPARRCSYINARYRVSD